MAENYYENKARELLEQISSGDIELDPGKSTMIRVFVKPDLISELAGWLKEFKQEKVDAVNTGVPSKSQSKGKGVG